MVSIQPRTCKVDARWNRQPQPKKLNSVLPQDEHILNVNPYTALVHWIVFAFRFIQINGIWLYNMYPSFKPELCTSNIVSARAKHTLQIVSLAYLRRPLIN